MSQDEVIAFLSSADGHPGGGKSEIVETHGAIIFLAGDVALKIKRDVTYDYMDLSTLALREAMLRRELELNRPVAPAIYRDVVAVTREPDGSLRLGGPGVPVEWVLRMWRFPPEAELSVIAERRGIDDTLARALGHEVHRFHAKVPTRKASGARLMGDILDELDRVFAGMGSALGPSQVEKFLDAGRAELRRIGPLLDERARAGHVRRCHGDLHLRNLVLLDGVPVPFDALEFDEILGTCDVLYDLAFLLMDLENRKLARAANIVLGSYLLAARGSEDRGLAALPLFLAVRAAIRAMVGVQTANATHTSAGGEPAQALTSAISFLAPPDPKLVLVGGLSGTGKTTVARSLAPLIGARPGAVHLRTDLERKSAPGIGEMTQATKANYEIGARRLVYARLLERAEAVLSAGHSVLIDATFLDPDMRQAAMSLGKGCEVETAALWLHAPLDTLVDRVRRRKDDASDADETVVRAQHAGIDAPADWETIVAGGSPEDTMARAASVLGLETPSAT